jgi:predicted metal-dependent phosphoesterase TrpH
MLLMMDSIASVMEGLADVHVHTKYSGLARLAFLRFPESISEPRDVVKAAKKSGLSVVCVTDHNSIRGGVLAQKSVFEFPGVEVVIGEEISTSDGEVIGLFLNEDIPKGLTAPEAIDRIRDQGGLVVAPHPFSRHVPALGLRIDSLDLDALEVFNAGHVDGIANNKAAEYAQNGKWAQVGGSDSHALTTIGCARTVFPGETAEDFRKAVRRKTTRAEGQRMPMNQVIGWSVGVVWAADKLILRSLIGGLNNIDKDDPVPNSVKRVGVSRKLIALVGSMVYFLPPVPYLVEIVGERVIIKKNQAPLGAIPVHETNGQNGIL